MSYNVCNVTHWEAKPPEEIKPWTYYRSYLANLLRYAPPGKILDVGAGLGGFTECATRFGLDCTGLEGDAYAVEAARARYPMDIRQQDLLLPWPFDEGAVSAVFANQVVEHLPPDRAGFFFSESYRVLTEGGVLVVHSPCRFNRGERKKVDHINLYTPRRLREEVCQAGFSDVLDMNYPRWFLGERAWAKLIMGVVFFLWPADWLSNTASLMARKSSDTRVRTRSSRRFYLEKVMHW